MVKLNIDRRRFLVAGALAGTAGAAGAAAYRDGELGAPPQSYSGTMPWEGGAADAPPAADPSPGYKFFTPAEADFIEAATERLIPGDQVGPGAIEAGVPIFIDRQLLGPFGQGQHFYLGGPWPKGVPEQGYQTRLSPAGLYRSAITAIERHIGATFKGVSFKHLSAADQDATLADLETGALRLDGVDAKTFFDMLLQNTQEGYFSDPIYGGNRNMAAWKMIGFPGARYDYKEWVGRHGERYPLPPVGLKGRPAWDA